MRRVVSALLVLLLAFGFSLSALPSKTAQLNADELFSGTETCQEYFDRRISEGWELVSLEGYDAVLLSPDGNVLRSVDLRNDTTTLRPNAAGDETAITTQLPGEGFHWDKVDEAGANDGDTTCVTTFDPSERDLYNLPASGIGGDTINFVKVYIWCREDVGIGSTWAKPSLKAGATTADGTGYEPTGSYTVNSHQWNTNPDDAGAWETADIDALQIGVHIDGDNEDSVYCSQVYVEIDHEAPVAPPTVTTQVASSVEETTATLNGNVTVINDTEITDRGFVWDTVTHGDPGDTAPGASDYANNWTENGSFGTGAFTHGLTSLSKGELYYVRACAQNDANFWAYGAEITFLTKPDPPYSFTATQTGDGVITVAWSKGTGAQNTYVRGEDGSYPTDRADGYLVYNDTGVTDTDTGLTGGHTYYYRAWSFATEGGKEQYSDVYDQDFALALSSPTVTTSEAEGIGQLYATLVGDITVLGNGNSDERGFVWDTGSQGDPGNSAPGASGYADNATTVGSYGVAEFTHYETPLVSGDEYFFRACAHNSIGWDYGAEKSFTTLELVLWFQPIAIILNTSVVDGVADAGSSDVKIIDAALTQANDYWNFARLVITNTDDHLAPEGEQEVITDFIAATDELQFDALTANVEAGDTYTVDFGTLVDRAGSNDGRITWGNNPSGVSVTIGSMASSGQPSVGEAIEDIPGSVLPEATVSDWYGDGTVGGSILTNPVRPFITMVSDNTDLTEILVWRWLGGALLLFVAVASARILRGHLGITIIIVSATMAGLVSVDHNIFPLWMLVLAVGMFIGGVVAERSPSL